MAEAQIQCPTSRRSPAISPAPQRSAFGIPDQSVILATVLNECDGPVSAEFVDLIVQCLRQHPTAVLLTTGDADTAALKRRLDGAGLGKRAGFTGRRKDVTEFLQLADVYLTPLGRPSAAGLLSAMIAGRCAVAVAGDGNDPHRPAAVLGDDYAVPDAAAYADRVGRLIRDPQARQRAGDANKTKAAAQHAMEQTVQALESLCRSLLEPRVQQPRSIAA